MRVLIEAMDAENDRILERENESEQYAQRQKLIIDESMSVSHLLQHARDVEKTTDATACDSDVSPFPANTEGSERIC